MRAFGLTDQGKRRERNEDSLLVDNETGLYIAADGMGGHSQGEVASRTAVTVINDFLKEGLKQAGAGKTREDGGIEDLLKGAIFSANAVVYEHSLKLNGDIMGTTVSLLLLKERRAYIAHVGDSRIYRLRKDRIEKLTMDHNKAQELVDACLLTEEEADNHRSSHVLTRALGSSSSVNPDIAEHHLAGGDSFLLSTDGLFRAVGIDTVQAVMTARLSVEEKCRKLVSLSLEGGAPDNVSVIVVESEKKGILTRIFS